MKFHVTTTVLADICIEISTLLESTIVTMKGGRLSPPTTLTSPQNGRIVKLPLPIIYDFLRSLSSHGKPFQLHLRTREK